MLPIQKEKTEKKNLLNIPELEFIPVQTHSGYICSNGVSSIFQTDDKIKAISFCYQINKIKKQLDLVKKSYNIKEEDLKGVL